MGGLIGGAEPERPGRGPAGPRLEAGPAAAVSVSPPRPPHTPQPPREERKLPASPVQSRAGRSSEEWRPSFSGPTSPEGAALPRPSPSAPT